jgi:hypothetical protein
VALAVRRRCLRLAAERHSARELHVLEIDGGGRLGAVREGERALARRIVDVAVGILADLHDTQHLQRLQIEDRHRTVMSVGDKAAAKLRRGPAAPYTLGQRLRL